MAGYRRILLGIDFSESSAGALDAAVDLAAGFGARLDLAHIVPLSGLGESEAQTALASFGPPQAAALVDSRTVTRALSPDLGLLQVARDRRADLIVLGTHGRTGLQHIRLGSTAERVVQNADCPVLTVRHPAFRSPRT
jgi:nucleotide-binding universal stress UspA family protein